MMVQAIFVQRIYANFQDYSFSMSRLQCQQYVKNFDGKSSVLIRSASACLSRGRQDVQFIPG